MELLAGLVCICAKRRLWFGSVEPSPATVHRTVAFEMFESVNLHGSKKEEPHKGFFFFGATGRTRTGDLLITNQLLYLLSHSSACGFQKSQALFYNISDTMSRKKRKASL